MLITSVQEALEAIQQDPFTLQYVPEEFQTEEVCLKAVKQDRWVLPFVKNQTEEMCIAAVRSNVEAFKDIKLQVIPIEVYAILFETLDQSHLRRLIKRTRSSNANPNLDINKIFSREFRYEVVKINGLALKHTTSIQQTKKLCLAAVRQNGLALEYVINPTEEIILAAVQQNPEAIKFAKPW